MAGTLITNTINTDTGIFSTNNAYSGIAKAWVQFVGTTATINGSFNVISVTRTSTGVYQINYAIAMPNANYAAVAGTSNDSTIRLDIYAMGSIRVVTNAAGGDATTVSVAVFSA